MLRRKIQKKAKAHEKRKAKKHRGKHFGGPGEPDYTRGKKKGEVKNWKSPVHSGVVKRAKQKGVAEIDSKSGFTEPAIKFAKKYGIKLFHRGKEIA